MCLCQMASTETGATLALSGISREEVRRGRDSAEAEAQDQSLPSDSDGLGEDP